MPKEKILVLGAGLAGLYSASLLQDQGYDVTVLEARDRVGGRTFTENGVDLGGQWVSSLQPRVMKLCEQFGLTLYRQYDEGMHISYLNHKREEYTGTLADAGLDHESKARVAMLEEYVKEFNHLAQSDNLMEMHRAFDQISFYQWCQDNIEDQHVRSLINYSFYANTCVDPKHASFFFWLYFLRLCGCYENIVSMRGGAQEFRIEGGAQMLSNKLSKNLKIIFNSEIVAIEKQDKHYRVKTKDGKFYIANKIISALPAHLLPRIKWPFSMSEERLNFYRAMKIGSVTKVVIQYDSPFWRTAGYSGAIISEIGPVCLCYDASNSQYYALVIFIFGAHEYTDKEVLDHLVSLLKNDAVKQSKKIIRKNWSHDSYSGGCYFAIPIVKHLTQYHHYLSLPIDNIFFAGTETANEWMGYMEGALESAERVVGQITNG